VVGALISSNFGFESMFFFYSMILVIVLLVSQVYMQETMKKSDRQAEVEKDLMVGGGAGGAPRGNRG